MEVLGLMMGLVVWNCDVSKDSGSGGLDGRGEGGGRWVMGVDVDDADKGECKNARDDGVGRQAGRRNEIR
jgi:hypothetical protein